MKHETKSAKMNKTGNLGENELSIVCTTAISTTGLRTAVELNMLMTIVIMMIRQTANWRWWMDRCMMDRCTGLHHGCQCHGCQPW